MYRVAPKSVNPQDILSNSEVNAVLSGCRVDPLAFRVPQTGHFSGQCLHRPLTAIRIYTVIRSCARKHVIFFPLLQISCISQCSNPCSYEQEARYERRTPHEIQTPGDTWRSASFFSPDLFAPETATLRIGHDNDNEMLLLF